ncbi:MAG: hypothetical protein K0S39_269 [Paenibacillus sp.]|jgi:hypothetical protein|nr:hypothetical protein [Paenibacillus sp.]
MQYYCIQCKMLHESNDPNKDIIFQSGFHYVDFVRFNAGLCLSMIPTVYTNNRSVAG